MAARMLPVELVEEPPDGSTPEPAATGRGPRRPHPVLLRLALVAAAALAGSLVADAAADHARIAALDAIPGALSPLSDDLRPRWTLDEESASLLDAGVLAGGMLVGPAGAGDRVDALVGIDADTGERRWSMPVTPPDAYGPEAAMWAWCSRAGDLVLCSAQAWSGAVLNSRPWEALWLLSPGDGSVVHSWTLDPGVARGFVADDEGGGLLVEQAGRDAGGHTYEPWDTADHLVVTASDPVTGERRWEWTSPSAAEAGGSAWAAGWSTGRWWLVRRGTHAWLLDASGTVREVDGLAAGGYVDAARGGALVEQVWTDGSLDGPDQVRAFTTAGVVSDLPGPPMWLTVDDGSAPGLLFLEGMRGQTTVVAAASSSSGAVRWTAEVPAQQGLLLRGTLVLLREGGLTALSASSGEVLWTASLDGTLRGLATDGDVVVVSHADATVEAFASGDGRRVWTRDLSGLGRGSTGTWVRLDSPLPYPVAMLPDGSAVVLG